MVEQAGGESNAGSAESAHSTQPIGYGPTDFADWTQLTIPNVYPIDPAYDPKPEQDWVKEIEQLPADLLATVRRRLSREAAAETGAVEALYDLPPGATRAIASEWDGWENTLVEQHGLGLFDAQLDAYENIYKAANGEAPLTEVFVRGIHEAACRSQDTYRAEVQANNR